MQILICYMKKRQTNRSHFLLPYSRSPFINFYYTYRAFVRKYVKTVRISLKWIFLWDDKIYPISLRLVCMTGLDAFDEWIIDFVCGSYDDGMLEIHSLRVSHPHYRLLLLYSGRIVPYHIFIANYRYTGRKKIPFGILFSSGDIVT